MRDADILPMSLDGRTFDGGQGVCMLTIENRRYVQEHDCHMSSSHASMYQSKQGATCLSVSKNACLFCTTSFVDAYVDTQQLHATSLAGRLPTRLAVFDTDVMGLHGLKPLLSVESQAAAFDIHMDTPDWPDGLIATSWHLWVLYTDLGFRVCSHYSQTQCGSLCERSQSNNISAPSDSIINSAHSCHLGFDHP